MQALHDSQRFTDAANLFNEFIPRPSLSMLLGP